VSQSRARYFYVCVMCYTPKTIRSRLNPAKNPNVAYVKHNLACAKKGCLGQLQRVNHQVYKAVDASYRIGGTEAAWETFRDLTFKIAGKQAEQIIVDEVAYLKGLGTGQ
jgi:hypothetical protein